MFTCSQNSPAEILDTAEDEAVEAGATAGATGREHGVRGDVGEVHADQQRVGRRQILQQAAHVIGNLRATTREITATVIGYTLIRYYSI